MGTKTGLVEKSIENVWIQLGEALFWNHCMLAVTRRIPELEEDAGAVKTETDARESTRKFLKAQLSLRYRREDEEPAGRKKVFLAGQLLF